MLDQNSRERPYPYLKRALERLRTKTSPIIVEIGACRTIPNHDLDDFSLPCCNDGHSTMIFTRTGYTTHSVDISRAQINNLATYYSQSKPENLHLYCDDGISFLEKFQDKIDLLYLDAWDVGIPNCPEKHAEAYRTAKKNLSSDSIIVVDDTDIDFINGEYFMTTNNVGGKGLVLAPILEKDGWKILFKGRQTAWVC